MLILRILLIIALLNIIAFWAQAGEVGEVSEKKSDLERIRDYTDTSAPSMSGYLELADAINDLNEGDNTKIITISSPKR